MRHIVLGLALLSVLPACGRLKNHHVLTGKPHAPLLSGQVRIVMEGAPAPEGFEEVAILQTVGSGRKAALGPLVEGMKKKALELGCNAIIRIRVDQGVQHATAVGVAGIVP